MNVIRLDSDVADPPRVVTNCHWVSATVGVIAMHFTCVMLATDTFQNGGTAGYDCAILIKNDVIGVHADWHRTTGVSQVPTIAWCFRELTMRVVGAVGTNALDGGLGTKRMVGAHSLVLEGTII